MKRFTLLFLSLSLIIAAFGCSKHDEIKSPVNFYYCTDPINYNSPEGVISAEIRDKSLYSDFIPLLNLYVKGPESNGFRSPFPENLAVMDIETEESLIIICMNDTFAQLSGHDLTLACVCLSKTVMDLTNHSAVRIVTETQPLDGNAYIQMTDHDFTFLDEFIPQITP